MNLKKPKFWDYKKPNIFAYLLLPITYFVKLIYLIKKIEKRTKFKIKTICVGNIYIGGTGKTSLSIKLNQILTKNNYKSCFVKKFYNNQLDEQNLLKKNGKLFVSSQRITAISQAENENFDVAILDDGLQDNSIEYDLILVCFNNINWIGNGMTIPSGPLRENIKNLKNYKNIFLIGNLENSDKLKKEILSINATAIIHEGSYEPVNLGEFDLKEKYLIFSGIGNHKTFVSMLKKYGFNISKDLEFSDHYEYTDKDINEILKKAENLNCKIITTEKDYLRINKTNYEKIKFIKSELKIIDEEKFIKLII